MTRDNLYTCPICQTPNFTHQGLRGHSCHGEGGKQKPRKLTPEEIQRAQVSNPPMAGAIDGKAELVAEPTATTPANPEEAGRVETLRHAWQDACRGLLRVVWFGALCLEEKPRHKHGEFKTWLAKSIPEIPYPSVVRYMQLAKSVADELAKKNAQLLEQVTLSRLLTAPDLRGPSAALQRDALELLDGKTQHELRMSLSAPPVPPKYHPPRKTTAELEAEKRHTATLRVKGLTTDLLALMELETLTWVDEEVLDALEGARIDLGRFIKQLRQGRNAA